MKVQIGDMEAEEGKVIKEEEGESSSRRNTVKEKFKIYTKQYI